MQMLMMRTITWTLCLFSAALALPQKDGGKSLAVEGNANDGMAVAVNAQGSQMRRELDQSQPNAQPAAKQNTAASLVHLARKPTGENITGHPPTLTAEEASDRLENEGLVDTFNAAADSSNVIKLEEETIECMMDTPVWECMEKHGSYGVRRLYTDSVDDYNELENWRKDWMSHPEVQRKRLYEITWPGTHDSGAYAFDPAIMNTDESGKASVKGAITQHLDVFTQLSIGVRAIELQIAVSKTDGQLYSANGFLMISLATILTDIASFLETHHEEVVLLYMRKADVYNGIEQAHVQPLKDEETNPEKIPGEAVHKGVEAIVGHHLATYKTLSSLPSTESPENPAMDAAIHAGIRVFYFWEGQQVLCVSKEECQTTPGWQRGSLGQPFAFGPGMPPGARTNMNNQGEAKTFVEPGCIHSSTSFTQSSNPIQLVLNVKKYASALMDSIASHPTPCFPSGAVAPPLHTPTVLYQADMWASPFTASEGAYRAVYKDIKEIYTRGESATLKSEAERVNYLALNWFLRKNWQTMFTKLNVIAMDYVAPVNVHRIIEANQGREDCGYAIYCKITGSCWAMTLLDPDANACKSEGKVLGLLKWHADGRPWPKSLIVFFIIALGILLKCCCIGTTCHLMGNKLCPSCIRVGGTGIWWPKREKKVEEPLVEEEAEGEGEEAEAEGQGEADF